MLSNSVYKAQAPGERLCLALLPNQLSTLQRKDGNENSMLTMPGIPFSKPPHQVAASANLTPFTINVSDAEIAKPSPPHHRPFHPRRPRQELHHLLRRTPPLPRQQPRRLPRSLPTPPPQLLLISLVPPQLPRWHVTPRPGVNAGVLLRVGGVLLVLFAIDHAHEHHDDDGQDDGAEDADDFCGAEAGGDAVDGVGDAGASEGAGVELGVGGEHSGRCFPLPCLDIGIVRG
ncbi:hypothetical protein B0T18DRAFT_132101 [Schizothecium vesticola]|uniref:Uncharacterized protein n=1 Tax=Schizothecium vesticola TaxID=314040 RepID=A0AA40ETV9_9PEZI|nr:hypothetical protein B0T18DRAFT_132101 [Schizothecium vesticola]